MVKSLAICCSIASLLMLLLPYWVLERNSSAKNGGKSYVIKIFSIALSQKPPNNPANTDANPAKCGVFCAPKATAMARAANPPAARS
jgi:hypothetical protein